MDDREKTILDLKKLEERDKSEGTPAMSVEEYLKSLAEGKESPEVEKPGGAKHDAGGHVHFRVPPPKSNETGHFP